MTKPARCKKHPRYQVKRKPRSTCEACWWQWLSKKHQYDYTVTAVEKLPLDDLVIKHPEGSGPRRYQIYRTTDGEADGD